MRVLPGHQQGRGLTLALLHCWSCLGSPQPHMLPLCCSSDGCCPSPHGTSTVGLLTPWFPASPHVRALHIQTWASGLTFPFLTGPCWAHCSPECCSIVRKVRRFYNDSRNYRCAEKGNMKLLPQASLQNYSNQLKRSRAVLLNKAQKDYSTDGNSFQINLQDRVAQGVQRVCL